MNYPYNPGRVKKVARVRRGFYIHLTAYVVVNALLIAINLATTPERLWFGWPLFGWGIGIIAHGVAAFAVTRERAPRGG